MTTGKCNDCGKSRMNGSVRCRDCHAQWLTDYMSYTRPEEKQDHWTFPEDENPKPQAGWKWINLNWLFKGWGEDLVRHHDRMTTSTDYSITHAKIPVWRKAQWWKEAAYELTMRKPKAGFQKMVARISSTFMRFAERFFDEGPLK